MVILRITAAVTLLYAVETVLASSDQVVLGSSGMTDVIRPEGTLPSLADVLTVETRASIFYSYSREVDVGARFTEEVGEGEGVTVFVPTNKAIQALARKPHQDPQTDRAGISDAEYESAARSNVRRWVGAHIVPHVDVDFTSTESYDTLTSGVTISFNPIKPHCSSHLPHVDTDADHFAALKGPGSVVDTDAEHFAGIKGPMDQSDQVHESVRPVLDDDTVQLSATTGPQGSDARRVKVHMGHAAAGRVDTDAAHFATIKHPISSAQTPVWTQYELNDGVHIIAKLQASNGVAYLIDGTVLV